VLVQAQQSIDLLLSDAQLPGNPLWEELLSAASRGVRVRVLLDASDWAPSIAEKNRPTIKFLTANGIEARFDDPSVTTHAKLVVIDCQIVILGSTNWNRYAFAEQEQANIELNDEQVGKVFATYFDRLWLDALPSDGIELDTTSLTVEEPLLVPIPETVNTRNYISILCELLRQATRSVHVVMYRASYYAAYRESLSNEILRELIDAVGRGLDVKVLLDDCAYYPDSASANLEAALYLYLHGVEVRFDDPTQTTHAKLVIIDEESVVLGSTNWNYYSLEKNNEVNLALINLPSVAACYEPYFQLLWASGKSIGR
jgi:phosphatidylserine/phosphatidylglycerophosphate/cardiolipin synthase-like enzyme